MANNEVDDWQDVSDWQDVPIDDGGVDDWQDVSDGEGTERPWYDVTAKGLAAGAIEAVPMATLAAGGLIGGLGGAGLGYAGGKEIESLLKQYLLGEEAQSSKPLEQLKRVGSNVASGTAAEAGGRVIGAIPGLVKGGYSTVKDWAANKIGANLTNTQVPNAKAIQAAAESIGVTPPSAVLSSNPTYQKLESGLSQSGSLPARSVKETYNKFYEGLKGAGEKISNLRSPESEFSLGAQIQEGLGGEISAMREPVTELYNQVTPILQKIPTDQAVVNKVFGALKKDPIFQTKDGIAFLNEYKNIVRTTPELASLKELRSGLQGEIGPTAAPIMESRVNTLRQALTQIRDETIHAFKNEVPKSMHREVDDLIDTIALADAAHAGNIKDINTIRGIVNKKEVSSPVTFLKNLEAAKEGDIAQKASNLDIGSLRNFKDKFPQVFEKAKQARINDMVQSSTNPMSGFSEAQFMRKYDSLDQELKDLLFEKPMQEHILNLQTVRQAIPPKLGPSGTPEGVMTMDMLSPKRNVMDWGIKKALEKASAPKTSLLPDVNKNIGQSILSPLLQKSLPVYESAGDTQPTPNDIVGRVSGSKYEKILTDAASRGGNSLNSTIYILSEQDQEFRKLIRPEE